MHRTHSRLETDSSIVSHPPRPSEHSLHLGCSRRTAHFRLSGLDIGFIRISPSSHVIRLGTLRDRSFLLNRKPQTKSVRRDVSSMHIVDGTLDLASRGTAPYLKKQPPCCRDFLWMVLFTPSRKADDKNTVSLFFGASHKMEFVP